MEPDVMLMLPLWYVVFVLSLTCHEAAHAFAAHRGGDPTAYLGGQVSLNPIPHMQREPFGTIIVPLVSFFLVGGGWMIGWASAPYDPLWEQRYPKRAALMAFAGPLANLILLAIGFIALKGGILAEIWAPHPEYAIPPMDNAVVALGASGAMDGLGRFLSVMISLNLVLFLFNLIPLPPMDGSAVLAGLIPAARNLRDWFLTMPMAGLIGLLVAWNVFPYVFRPAYVLMIEALWR